MRHGFRSLVKSPGLTCVALTALALGIGANATVFTLTNAVLFKGYPFDKADRIMYLSTRNVRNSQFAGVSYPDMRDWRGQVQSFDEGEVIVTEHCYKYTLPGFARLASQAGLWVSQVWCDAEERFSVQLLEPVAR